MDIVVYSKTTCGYCQAAKKWLRKHDLAYREIMLDDDEQRQNFYETVGNGVRSVPVIFVDGQYLGGYRDLLDSDLAKRQTTRFDDLDF